MKATKSTSRLFQQRLGLLLALLFCLFVTSVEYIPQQGHPVKTEKHDKTDSSDHNLTFLNVAVNAVVPFVVQVSHSVFYLMYEIFHFVSEKFISESTISVFQNQLVQILFERIISTKGP